ncbi:MAG: PilZ domain-containing protein, partial [Nitrospirae bacterium]|nr:PilZ domain-containing protein [Nitrospirota bacterium]
MGRLDVRCNVSIPVTILSGSLTKQRVETKNLGLKGAFLNTSLPVKEDEIIKLKAEIPEIGEFESDVRIVRKDKNGIAVRFLNIDKRTTRILWNYIKGHLSGSRECPFCGFNNNITSSSRCTNCGLIIDIKERDFNEIDQEITKQWIKYIESATVDFIKQFNEVEELYEYGTEDSETIYSRLSSVFDEFINKAELFETGISNEDII